MFSNLQTLHFLTDGIAAHLNIVLADAEVVKGAAGMIWVNIDGGQLGAIMVQLVLNDGEAVSTSLAVMNAGTGPGQLLMWLHLAGIDAEDRTEVKA